MNSPARIPRHLFPGLIIAALASGASATPTVQDPLDVPARMTRRAAISPITALAPVAGKELVAVGMGGKILRSPDLGRTWAQLPAPVSSDLTAVRFPSPRVGWAVGHDGVVLHSTDGGQTWERRLDGRQYGEALVRYYEAKAASGDASKARALEDARRFKEEGPDKPFLDLWFEDEKTGWIVGAFNLILKTSDGGQTWEPWIDRTDNDQAYTFYAMGSAGGDIYIVGELGLVLRLDRAQQRFVRVVTPYEGSFFGLAGRPGSVVVYGLRGNALRSQDGGKSWMKLDTGISGPITSGAYLDDGRLLLASTDGQVMISADNGNSFAKLRRADPTPVFALAPTGQGGIVTAGPRGLRLESLK